MTAVLPDSRLSRPDFGVLMQEWPGTRPDGQPWGRIETVPVFCANCGIPYGYVPKASTTFAFWLCIPCSETYGKIAGTMMMPEDEFWEKVQAEMIENFGHVLNQEELAVLEVLGWGPLASLVKDSPIKVFKK